MKATLVWCFVEEHTDLPPQIRLLFYSFPILFTDIDPGGLLRTTQKHNNKQNMYFASRSYTEIKYLHQYYNISPGRISTSKKTPKSGKPQQIYCIGLKKVHNFKLNVILHPELPKHATNKKNKCVK